MILSIVISLFIHLYNIVYGRLLMAHVVRPIVLVVAAISFLEYRPICDLCIALSGIGISDSSVGDRKVAGSIFTGAKDG